MRNSDIFADDLGRGMTDRTVTLALNRLEASLSDFDNLLVSAPKGDKRISTAACRADRAMVYLVQMLPVDSSAA